jgi:hypothetical protein
MMATHFHRCGMGSICLTPSSHGSAFLAPPPVNRQRDASLRNAPPKHAIDDVFGPFGTRSPSYQPALSSSESESAPFNAHSRDGVGAA